MILIVAFRSGRNSLVPARSRIPYSSTRLFWSRYETGANRLVRGIPLLSFWLIPWNSTPESWFRIHHCSNWLGSYRLPPTWYGQTDGNKEVAKRVEELAKKRNLKMAQIATAWSMQKDGVFIFNCLHKSCFQTYFAWFKRSDSSYRWNNLSSESEGACWYVFQLDVCGYFSFYDIILSRRERQADRWRSEVSGRTLSAYGRVRTLLIFDQLQSFKAWSELFQECGIRLGSVIWGYGQYRVVLYVLYRDRVILTPSIYDFIHRCMAANWNSMCVSCLNPFLSIC